MREIRHFLVRVTAEPEKFKPDSRNIIEFALESDDQIDCEVTDVTATPLITRQVNLNAYIDEYGDYMEDQAAVPRIADKRYLLIERSTRDSRTWLTLHDTAEAASDYSTGQEYAGDWDPEVLVDLEAGLSFHVKSRSIQWELDEE